MSMNPSTAADDAARFGHAPSSLYRADQSSEPAHLSQRLGRDAQDLSTSPGCLRVLSQLFHRMLNKNASMSMHHAPASSLPTERSDLGVTTESGTTSPSTAKPPMTRVWRRRAELDPTDDELPGANVAGAPQRHRSIFPPFARAPHEQERLDVEMQAMTVDDGRAGRSR